MQRLPILTAFLLLSAGSLRADWIVQTTPAGTNVNFRSVQVVNSNVVWAGGSHSTFLRTVDGGTHWEKGRIPGPEEQDFRGMAAFDARNAIAVSAGESEKGLARIYRTDDGGNSWSEVFQTNEKGAFLDGVAFWDEKNGLALGDPIGGKWVLLRTSDGGRHWSRISPGKLPAMMDKEAAFAASNSAMVTQGNANVWIASGGGARARVFRSSNRGESWQVTETSIAAGESSGLFGLRFWDATHGIAVGGDHMRNGDGAHNVLTTTDGGVTWQLAGATKPAGLKSAAVRFADDRLLVAGPSGSSISKDFGKTWNDAGGPGLHALSADSGVCWGVGSKGVVAMWHDSH